MHAVDLSLAGRDLPTLAERAAKGEDVVLLRDGLPFARLTAIRAREGQASPEMVAKRRAGFGALHGKLSVPDDLLEPMSEAELSTWYGEKAT